MHKTGFQPSSTENAALALRDQVDSAAMVTALLQRAGHLLGCEAGCIVVANDGARRLAYARGWPASEIEQALTRPATEDILLLETTTAVTGVVVVDDARESHLWPSVGVLNWIRSYAAVPILFDGAAVGHLCLASRRPNLFSAVEPDTFGIFADSAALALQNIRLQEQVSKHAVEMELFQRISDKIGAQIDLPETLHVILEGIIRLTDGATTARIFLYEETRLKSGMVLDVHSRISSPLEEPEPDSLYYRVARNGERFVTDAEGLQHEITGVPSTLTGSSIAAPLRIGQRTVGVLSVHFETTQTCGADVLRVMQLLGDQAAVAIENAQFYRRAERRGSEMDFLLGVMSASAIARPIDEALAEVAFLIRSALDALAVAIYLPDLPHEDDQEMRIVLTPIALDGGDRSASETRSIIVGDPDSLPGMVAVDMNAEVFDGLQDHSGYDLLNARAESSIIVPLIKGEALKGLITVEFAVGGNPYDVNLMELLIVLSGTLPSIIENMLLWNQLSESEKRFRQLAETVREVFFLIDPLIHKVLYVSPAFVTVWQQPITTCLGHGLGAFLATIHAEDRSAVVAQRDRAVAAKPIDSEVECRILRPDGESRLIRLRMFPLQNADGQVYRLAATAEDITERHVAEAQAMELVVEKHKTQAMGEFITNMSHDFRTPLATINTSAYLLGRTSDSSARLARVDVIAQQVNRLDKLLDGLLTITRLDQGSEYRFVSTVVSAVIAEIAPLVRVAAEARQITVAFESDADPFVSADVSRLDQAIMNLVQNAIQFSPAGGRVIIRTGTRGEFAVIEVRDFGIGIHPDDLAHLFERFYRADRSRGPETGGIGLGLTITRKIVESHGGTVEVESAVDQGSSFRILLPVL